MATVNLGAIKFNWKGAYAGGTAYVADDVVSYLGSSYVCILASTGNVPTNGTYWNIMSSAGTNGTNGSNGTDVGTVITTQGDMLYRDGSGLQRLAKGTAGQDLRMNSGATAPEWYTASGGGVLQCKYAQQTGTDQWTTDNVMIGPTVTLTPSSASNKIVIMSSGMLSGSTSITGSLGLRRSTGGTVANNATQIYGGAAAGSRSRALQFGGANSETWFGVNFSFQVLDAPNTTSTISYRLCSLGIDGGVTMYLGRTGRDTDNTEHPRTSTHIMAMEISSTIL